MNSSDLHSNIKYFVFDISHILNKLPSNLKLYSKTELVNQMVDDYFDRGWEYGSSICVVFDLTRVFDYPIYSTPEQEQWFIEQFNNVAADLYELFYRTGLEQYRNHCFDTTPVDYGIYELTEAGKLTLYRLKH